MDILYLAHRIPFPPDKGCKLRAFRQLERLSRRHRVWCACFVDTQEDLRHVSGLSPFCHRLAPIRLGRSAALARGLAGLARGHTLTEAYYRHAGMRAVLERWRLAVRFDAVAVFSSAMAQYAWEVPAGRRVLDLCDLDSRKWSDYASASRGLKRWLYQTEGRRLAQRERDWLTMFDGTMLITQAEAKPLSDAPCHEKLHIVGNGVELPTLGQDSEPSAETAVVGFIGVMDYKPNIDGVRWFVEKCWPAIHRQAPESVFRVVGRRPTSSVRRLARVPGVEVVGEVPDALAQVRQFDVSVAPLRIARGQQNKVLEAMAVAKPVVLTSGAAEGIAANDGEEYAVADRPEDFAQRVIQLLRHPAERRLMGAAARAFVSTHHRWESALDAYERIVTGVLSTGSCEATHLASVRNPKQSTRTSIRD